MKYRCSIPQAIFNFRFSYCLFWFHFEIREHTIKSPILLCVNALLNIIYLSLQRYSLTAFRDLIFLCGAFSS